MDTANRNEVETKFVVEGAPLRITLLQNPIIDDVLVSEARVQATSVETGDPSLVQERRVGRDLRDFLIRLGVER